MASKELIEKVALHIRANIAGDEYSMSYGLSTEEARAASMALLAEILAALQEPTFKMEMAGEKTGDKYDGTHEMHLVWKAMLNASTLGEQSE